MEWERIDDAWNHCGRPGWIGDDGVTCSKCQTTMSWDDDDPAGPNLVFVDLDNGTVADCGNAFVIDPDTANLSPGEIDVLDAADSFGSFGPDAAAIVRRAGVPFADLWAAYEWRRDMVTVGILADVEDYVVRIMPDENPPCPVCHYPLSDHDVAGFPCDGCTESQPMGVWVSSWAVES